MSLPYVSKNSRQPSESSQFFSRVSRVRRVPVKESETLVVYRAMTLECINPEGIRFDKPESNGNGTVVLYGLAEGASVSPNTGADHIRQVLSKLPLTRCRPSQLKPSAVTRLIGPRR